MDTRIERIVLETGRHRITGDLTMPREGYRSRLSDYLNRGEMAFIPLANAVTTKIDHPGDHAEHEFLAVARSQVHLAYFTDDGRSLG